MSAYALNTDIGNYLNISLQSTGQAMVDSLLTNFSDLIDAYCNRTWRNTNPLTEKFDAGFDRFFIAQPPIQDVVSVTIGGIAIDPQYIFNYKTFIRIYQLPQVWIFPLLTWFQAVTVVYNSAATVVPNDVKQALIRWVAEEFQKSPDGGRATDSVSTGSVKIQYRTDKNGMPEFVKMVLDNYRLAPLDRF